MTHTSDKDDLLCPDPDLSDHSSSEASSDSTLSISVNACARPELRSLIVQFSPIPILVGFKILGPEGERKVKVLSTWRLGTKLHRRSPTEVRYRADNVTPSVSKQHT